MTVSSSASSFRPGVCLSTNRPVSPYEGQVIYESDTDRTLVWNGSSWIYLATSSQYKVGVELVSSAEFTNVPYTEVTGFSSAFQWYDLYFSGVNVSSPAASTVLCVLYDGATARNSQYYGGNHYMGYDGTAGAQYNQNNAGDFYGTTLETRYRGNFTMRIFRASGQNFSYNTNGFDSMNFRSFHGGGFRNGTESWDRIRLTGVSRNITGQWSLYGREL